MSSKEKLIASAQKSLDKGQIAKAIKDYQKVVELDPKDVRNRQKLAELYGRARMADEALATYEAVAKFYVDGGFFLKAIAVYKQMQKLDPGQVRIYLRLAELNEKQGLTGNALAEYRNLVAHYEKHQMPSEAIGVLQKMKALDPGSLNIRVKVAESCVQAGQIDAAKAEFEEILAILKEKEDYPRIVKFYEFFLSLCPDDVDLQVGLADTWIGMGEGERGIRHLKALLHDHADHLGLLKVLARGYRTLGDRENSQRSYRHLLRLVPDDLDLKEEYLDSSLAAGDANEALTSLKTWKDVFFDAGRVAAVKQRYEQLRDLVPDNPQVVEALHDIYQRTGEGDKLFDLITTASHAETELKEQDASAPSVSIEVDVPSPAAEKANDDVNVEAQAFLSQFEESGVLGADTEPSLPQESPRPALPEDLDLELELELDLDDGAPEPAFEPVAGETLDAAELTFVAEEPSAAATSAARSGADDPNGELEEAEFYLQQELFDEAEKICRELLTASPDFADAQRMMAEIERRRQGRDDAEPADTVEYFDLAAEIMDDTPVQTSPEAARAADVERFRLDGALSEFKKGVESQIGSEDAESHYNLGIAYKEMGLLDDAITEFNRAMKHEDRMIGSLTLKGICLLEKGEFAQAEEVFKAGLAYPQLSAEERVSLGYEMGLLYEGWGHPREALENFQKVAAVDPFFRSVSDKVTDLRKTLGIAPEPGDEASAAKGNKDRVSYL